jgi:hypothetical protein
MNSALTLDDIADGRAYEREREAFRARIIELKKIRRVHVGPVVAIVFENRETIRFQVQEMARAERLMTDAAIQTELDTYNPLIPAAYQLSATLFIELTSRDEMEEWLPRLVGIERSLQLRLAGGEVVHNVVEAQHATQLTREEITAAVHYVRFELDSGEVDRFREAPVVLAVDHREYQARATLPEATRASLLADLLG